MATIVESLRALNAYPIPVATLVSIAEGRGLSPDEQEGDITAYELATADVYMWLSYAPDVTQGGQSYSFSDEQRKRFRQEASAIIIANGGRAASKSTIYGYKGSRL
ncbi:MAG: hypothetical protein II288_03995 [Alistipes sp.]|nr:hypothetical protein [Alistipes sp.]